MKQRWRIGKVRSARTEARGLKSQNVDYWLLTTDYCSRGFTLLEVLVASAILSIVFAILYGVFSQTLTSKRIAEERASRSRAARIVLLRIGEDLQASFPFTQANTHFVGETRRTSNFPDASLSFMSFANVPLTDIGREADWCEIKYELVSDPMMPSFQQLVRWVRLSPQVTETDRAPGKGGEALPLLSGVQGLRFRFFDGRTWYEQWGQENTRGQIPRAVEVELYLNTRGKRDPGRDTLAEVARFSTIVDLPLAGSLANNLPRPGAT